MKQNINIEAEGLELILKNKAGDYVIIPKKYRAEVQGMIKDGCHSCIDKVVETLPVMNDYAEDGSLFPDWNKVKATLNPKNWGVPDYSDKGNFNTAYSTARKAGEKEFMWNNTRYTTNYDGTPQQQLKETGITDKQIHNRSNIEKRLSKNLNPVSYKNIGDRVIETVFYNKKELSREVLDNSSSIEAKKRLDAFNLYTGIPQKNNTFKISNSKPSISKDINQQYYSFTDDAFYDALLNDLENDILKEKDSYLSYPKESVMGNFKVSNGNDEKGDYISYYDKWDLNPFDFKNPINKKEITTDFGKPFEIYDRIYYRKNPRYNDDESTLAKNMLTNTNISKHNDDYELNSHYNGKKIYKNKNTGFIIALPDKYKDIEDFLAIVPEIVKQKKYIRQYYSDKELSELDINKKNFDTLALQRELSNRGYKLPKSTKENGTLDGIWGDETKNALLDYQTKNKPVMNNYAEGGPLITKDKKKITLERRPYTAVQSSTYVAPKVIPPLEKKPREQPVFRADTRTERERKVAQEYTESVLNPSISTQIGEALQLPLRWMANPIKVVGDIASFVAPNSALAKDLPNTNEDLFEYRKKQLNPYISRKEKINNTINEATNLSINSLINASTLELGFILPRSFVSPAMINMFREGSKAGFAADFLQLLTKTDFDKISDGDMNEIANLILTNSSLFSKMYNVDASTVYHNIKNWKNISKSDKIDTYKDIYNISQSINQQTQRESINNKHKENEN